VLAELPRAIRAEVLKLRRSLTSWAILAGGLFVPLIMLAVRYHGGERTLAMYGSGSYWRQHWLESWESISILILPLLIVLVTTLVIQIEYRNNTWKQLHASPLALPVIYAAKLIVLLGLLAAVFAVVSAGLYVAGWLPLLSLVVSTQRASPFPARELLGWSARWFLDCLPIVGLQLALALRFRSVLVPLGSGIACWVAGLVVINSRYVVAVPYAYVGVDYLIVLGHRPASTLPVNPPLLAVGVFAVSMVAGLAGYALARDRGANQ
jgi:lantibiotic transport system permease protein